MGFHVSLAARFTPIGYCRLLVQALEDTGKVGIAKVVIRNKQHLAAVRPYEGVLLLETMNYAGEVRKPERVNGHAKLKKAEVVDLMSALRESVKETQRKRKPAGKRTRKAS